MPYKKIDLAVAACTKLSLPLTVIGKGPEHKSLVKIAGPSVTFKTTATDEEVAKYLQSTEGFIFPGIDDFGIVAVEAMSTGAPVIAFKAGGALDYVVDGKTGLFFDQQTAKSLGEALRKFSTLEFSPNQIRSEADKFKKEQFREHILDYLSKLVL